MPKNQAKLRVLEVTTVSDICFQCSRECRTTINSPKGLIYLCSNQCQNNFLLQAGLKGYNQVRHKEDLKLTTVGKLNELTAKELERIYRFKHKLTRDQMNRNKEGDSIDRLFSSMGLRLNPKKSRRRVQTRMPFNWECDCAKAECKVCRATGLVTDEQVQQDDNFESRLEEPDNLPW